LVFLARQQTAQQNLIRVSFLAGAGYWKEGEGGKGDLTGGEGRTKKGEGGRRKGGEGKRGQEKGRRKIAACCSSYLYHMA
jgi:hypothetical protein